MNEGELSPGPGMNHTCLIAEGVGGRNRGAQSQKQGGQRQRKC